MNFSHTLNEQSVPSISFPVNSANIKPGSETTKAKQELKSFIVEKVSAEPKILQRERVIKRA